MESEGTEKQCIEANFPHIASIHTFQRTKVDKDVTSKLPSNKIFITGGNASIETTKEEISSNVHNCNNVCMEQEGRNDLPGRNFDPESSLKYMDNEPQKNTMVVTRIQSIEVTDSTTPIQMDAYDVIRGSENPSPKSVDSQFSVEDKVIYI